ncbi:MAG TPA: PEGA domain-containing protein [Methanolinea sp.]|nr:PEGA domain-containing protein [Methanolinea sp.]HQK55674.1 PEGA domain-containing protein [Methanolinea sp.]
MTPEQTLLPPEGMAYREQIGGDVGYYSISSVPSGADVIFDGKFLGETPVVTEVYATGTPSHSISVSKYGYNTWTMTYNQNPSPGQTIYVNANLQPVVQTGTIQVSSSPTGAIARLDGGLSVTTPGNFMYVTPGYHTVEISMAGYFPYSTSVSVSAGGTSSVSASLSPMQTTGSLRVTSSPPGAEVYVDEIYRGYTPLIVGSLSAGRHAVRLHLSGYQDYTQNVDISTGSQSTVSVSLTPLYQPTTGDILVSSVPDGAAIYLDGNYRGKTLQGNPFDITGVAPGTHTVTLLKSGYQDYSTTVAVSAGKTSTVSVSLTAGSVPSTTGDVMAQSSPSGADVYLDNVYKGFTPLSLHDVPVGSHVVTFRMPGYTDAQVSAQVSAGQTTPVMGMLSPVPTTAPTRSPLPVTVVAGALAILGVHILGRKR